MTEHNNKPGPEQAPKAADNPFYKMAIDESKAELDIIQHLFAKASRDERMEDACRAAETLARIRQAAMAHATRMNIMIAEANMRARQGATAPVPPSPKLAAVKNEDAER
jgi:hypothetical protein